VTRRQWIVVAILLGPVYVAAAMMGYWLFWPMPPTLEVAYSHPLFCDRPCETREEAKQFQIAEVPSGTPYVWHYREIQINAQRVGAIRSSWQSGAFIWNSPQIATLGSEPGHYTRAVAVEPPTSSPTRLFTWRLSFHYDVTPMRTEDIAFQPVQLRVVASPK
jgi:hypothetical protein